MYEYRQGQEGRGAEHRAGGKDGAGAMDGPGKGGTKDEGKGGRRRLHGRLEGRKGHTRRQGGEQGSIFQGLPISPFETGHRNEGDRKHYGTGEFLAEGRRKKGAQGRRQAANGKPRQEQGKAQSR